MRKQIKTIASLVLTASMIIGLTISFGRPVKAEGSYTDTVYDTGVSIPLNTETEVHVGVRNNIYEEYYAFPFTTGSKRAYYTLGNCETLR